MTENNQNENIADYVEPNQTKNYSNKSNQIKQKIADVCKEFCKPLTVAGVTLALYNYSPKIVDFLGKYTGKKDLIFNVGLDDIATVGLSALAFYGSHLIAKKYNPVEKIATATLKGPYFVLKNTFGPIIGEGLLRYVSPKAKWREKLSNVNRFGKWLYKRNVKKDNKEKQMDIDKAKEIIKNLEEKINDPKSLMKEKEYYINIIKNREKNLLNVNAA
ncbi:MAG: hypothetical protein KJ968_02505 [Nanoarchaeota archaeon]|nr:hypothetical protein [Nanoarchaeota archaeon]